MDAAAVVAPWVAAAPDRLAGALRAGLDADSVGSAFLAGYRAALQALVPGIGRAALCATEDGPVHPRSIRASWADGRVTGTKSFVTGVPGAERLLVVVRVEERIRVADVAADAPGVSLAPMPPTPFVPEIPHARLVLDAAPGALLPGDGWADVVKPFRTVEDVYVTGAVVAHLVATAVRCDLGADAVAGLAGALAGLVAAAGPDPRDPAGHVALAGVLAQARAVVGGLRWPPGADADRLARDLPLLGVAQRARDARLRAAWGA